MKDLSTGCWITGFLLFLVFSVSVAVGEENDGSKRGELTRQAYEQYKSGQYKAAVETTLESLRVKGFENDIVTLANLAALYKILGDDDSAGRILEKMRVMRAQLQEEYEAAKKASGMVRVGTTEVQLGDQIGHIGPQTDKFFEVVGLGRAVGIYRECEENALKGLVIPPDYYASQSTASTDSTGTQ